MDILIVKLGALGDVINTLPLAINLRRHLSARIYWLVEPLSYPLISEHPLIDHAILFNKFNWQKELSKVIEELRSYNFDLAIDLQRILKSSFFCMAARPRRCIGFDRRRCKEMSWIFPFERIPASDSTRHMVFQYLEFATYLGIKRPEIRWDIPVTGVLPFDLPDEFVVLNIGATKSANRWTMEGFALLAKLIMRRFNFFSVLTGGSEDSEAAKGILDMSGGDGVINLVGKTTIIQLKEILAASKVVVSCDTGPMHLAVAMGKYVIALFGPSDPGRTGPFKGDVVKKDIACAPCNRRKCRNPVCMTAITPGDVIERMERLWSVSS